jgi:hypothetical protein
MPNYNMRGVQFLTDNLGNKTAAIVGLKERSAFWAAALAECGSPIDFQFLVDARGAKIAVLLDFEKHRELWEDVCGCLTIGAIALNPQKNRGLKRLFSDNPRITPNTAFLLQLTVRSSAKRVP